MRTEDDLPDTNGHYWTQNLYCQNGKCRSTWSGNRKNPRKCTFARNRAAPQMTDQLKIDIELYKRHMAVGGAFIPFAKSLGMTRHEASAAKRRAMRYFATMDGRN